MIDISDGLSSEILHLCEDSGVGCRLYEDRIPYDDQTKRMAQELNINPLVAALNGGEDYELLFTIPLADRDKIKNHPDITILGHMLRIKREGILLERTDLEFENEGVFNPAVYQEGDIIYLFYRAVRACSPWQPLTHC